MAYPFDKKGVLIPREPGLDRRVRLTARQRVGVRRLYFAVGGWSQRKLAEHFGVSRRTIQFVLFPEKYATARKQFIERRKDGRYKPTKEKWRKTQAEHRAHKKKLYQEGKLISS